MRLNRWLFALGVVGVGSGALAEQACSTGNYCTGSGASETCFIYTPEPTDAGVLVVTKKDAGAVDGAADAYVAWSAGNGMACPGPVGGFPVASCDPSDETAAGCGGGTDAGCLFDKRCGNTNTCEPFVANPLPGTGVDNYRMRLINLTAPPALVVGGTIQAAIVSPAVDLPTATDAGGAPCGENGSGLFNWLMQVDKTKGTLVTGGAPPTTDPFGLGYCFLKGTVGTTAVAPVTIPLTFTGDSFASKPLDGVLNIPIFLPPLNAGDPVTQAVILPIRGIALSDVTISDDGNCIGAINTGSDSVTTAPNLCSTPTPTGTGACAHWHSAGTFAGYITTQDADGVVVSLLNESLCVLLAPAGDSMGTMYKTCNAAGLASGDYCSKTGQPCTNGDSFWLSAQFAASAVNIYDPKTSDAGTPPPLCVGGKL